MNSTTSRRKKSPSSKARKVGHVAPCAPSVATNASGGQRTARPTTALPTRLERETLLTPLWVAESIVQEVERFLRAELPAGWARRLAVKARYLYPRHKHFHKGLNRPGNRGRENLLMFMRHWTYGWLLRERNPLHKRLPESFGQGKRLATR